MCFRPFGLAAFLAILSGSPALSDPCKGLRGNRPPLEVGQATTLDPSRLRTGDIIAFSRLMAETPFVVQAMNGSPIDHVVFVAVEADGLRVFYDFVNPTPAEKAQGLLGKLRRMSFDEMMKTSQASPAWLLGRPVRPLTKAEEETFVRGAREFYEGQRAMPRSCTLYIRSVFALIGREVGTVMPDAVQRAQTWFGKFPIRAYEIQIPEKEAVVPLTTVLEGAIRVRAFHLWHRPQGDPRFWDQQTMWETWTTKGDMSRIARMYAQFRAPELTSQEARVARFRSDMETTLPRR